MFDDTSATKATLDAAQPWVQYRFTGDDKRQARFFTLTSGTGDPCGDPRSWVVKGSNDGVGGNITIR